MKWFINKYKDRFVLLNSVGLKHYLLYLWVRYWLALSITLLLFWITLLFVWRIML